MKILRGVGLYDIARAEIQPVKRFPDSYITVGRKAFFRENGNKPPVFIKILHIGGIASGFVGDCNAFVIKSCGPVFISRVRNGKTG